MSGKKTLLHIWRSSKLEQLGYPSIFQLWNFCLNCQKGWHWQHILQLWQMISNKIL